MRENMLRQIYSKRRLIRNFDFDALLHPPIRMYLFNGEVDKIRYLVTSAKYSGRSKSEKFKMIDQILNPIGFKRFHAGTNRVIYKNEYDHSFLLKIAVDDIGMRDNQDELYNQNILKPFVPKVFDVTPCGTIQMAERVTPITNRYEFLNISGEIFDIMENYFLGRYVLEDIGTDFFMNWGIRDGFGPVLLDFPYLYEIDGDKLKCSRTFQNGSQCDGTIDYDNGLNTLVCEKCGQRFAAKDLSTTNNIKKAEIIKGEDNMEELFEVGTMINGKEYKLFNESY